MKVGLKPRGRLKRKENDKSLRRERSRKKKNRRSLDRKSRGKRRKKKGPSST